MIDLEKLKEAYEAASGLELFRDFAELDASLGTRSRRDIRWGKVGVFVVEPTTLTAVTSPFIGVLTASVIVLALPDTYTDTVDALNTAAEELNGTSSTIDTYTVTWSLQTAAAGEIQDFGHYVGQCVPIRQTMSVQIIEGGRTSCKVYLDGLPIPILSITRRKVDVTQSMPDADTAATRVQVEQTAVGIDLQTPALVGGAAEIIAHELRQQSGEKLAHLIEIDEYGQTDCYLMYLTTITEAVQPPLCIGYTISAVEAPRDADIPLHFRNIAPTSTDIDGKYRLYNFPVSAKGCSVSFADGGGHMSGAVRRFSRAEDDRAILCDHDHAGIWHDIYVGDIIFSHVFHWHGWNGEPLTIGIADEERQLITFVGGAYIGIKAVNAVSHFCLVDGDVTIVIDTDGKITEDMEIPVPAYDHSVKSIAVGTRWRYDRYDLR